MPSCNFASKEGSPISTKLKGTASSLAHASKRSSSSATDESFSRLFDHQHRPTAAQRFPRLGDRRHVVAAAELRPQL
jgi:hypothetical protein